MKSPVARIFEAAKNDDLETVKKLIENGGMSPSVTRPHSGKTLAHVAAKRGNLDVLKYLAEKDSSLLMKENSEGFRTSFDDLTVIETAVKYGHLDIVRYLVEMHDVNIFAQRLLHSPVYRFYSVVELAIIKGHLNIVRYFIEEGHVDPNTNQLPVKDNCGRNPLLFAAVERKRHNITQYLIEDRKVDLTVLDEKKRNILFPAVSNGDFDFIKNVLDIKKAKIDINWRDNKGKTLVYWTVYHNHIDILQYVVEQKQADVNIPDGKENNTPLLEAIRLGYFKVFEYLINHGADVKSKNNKGETPLLIAIAVKNFEASKCLIDFSGNVNEKIYDGETLLHIVVAHNQLDLVKYLVNEKYARINVTREKDHWTPLHCAAIWGYQNICKFLIKKGADPRAKDKMGRSPAQVASNKALIDYIQKAAGVRSRRSVDHSFWIPSQHSATNSGTYLLSGGWNVEETATANEIEAFHLHSTLAFINFVIRYLFPSFLRTRKIEDNDDLAPNLPNRVEHFAEDAVHASLDFVEEEEEE